MVRPSAIIKWPGTSLRCWGPRGLCCPIKPPCIQCCTEYQHRMRQNKQPRPRNPKGAGGLPLQVRGSWVGPVCLDSLPMAGWGRALEGQLFVQDGGSVCICMMPGTMARGGCEEHSDFGFGVRPCVGHVLALFEAVFSCLGL